MDNPEKGSRIPYLDGLRAYSILLVVLGHASDTQAWLAQKPYLRFFLPDASLGVRIFFVLSGFLITSLLLNERDATGRISIRGFYERRIARIVPASYLYIAAIGVLTALQVTRVPLGSFLAAVTYTVNIPRLWGHAAASMQAVEFGHFWTLSIEEQFYLFWPGMLVFLGNRWSRRLATACVFLFPLFRMAVYPITPHQAFGPGPLRTIQDVIMWGAIGAFAAHNGLVERMREHRMRWAYPWIAGVIFFGVSGWLQAYPFEGLDIYLLPTLQSLAALLLIFWLLSGKGGLLRKGLEAWPVAQLGLLSYSLYIWQQLFMISPAMHWLAFPWNALTALGAAVLSYRLVETPMRKRIRQWFRQPQPAH